MNRPNYTYLLGGLFTVLVIAPSLAHAHQSLALVIVPISFSLTLLIGVWSLLSRWFLIGLGLAVAVAPMSIGVVVFAQDLSQLRMAATLAFLALASWQIVRDVLLAGKVDVNRLVGAVCLYLMLGLAWALLYSWLELTAPGTFKGVEPSAITHTWDFVYFSFVTITTLGYGDISPNSPLAQVLAYMEAITGQFYIAILVATLVGAHLTERAFAQSAQVLGLEAED